MYKKAEIVEVALIGDNMSGKSALRRVICDKAVQDYVMFKRHSAEFDKWELPQYYETEYTEIGV